jgi:hypothetical protein
MAMDNSPIAVALLEVVNAINRTGSNIGGVDDFTGIQRHWCRA